MYISSQKNKICAHHFRIFCRLDLYLKHKQNWGNFFSLPLFCISIATNFQQFFIHEQFESALKSRRERVKTRRDKMYMFTDNCKFFFGVDHIANWLKFLYLFRTRFILCLHGSIEMFAIYGMATECDRWHPACFFLPSILIHTQPAGLNIMIFRFKTVVFLLQRFLSKKLVCIDEYLVWKLETNKIRGFCWKLVALIELNSIEIGKWSEIKLKWNDIRCVSNAFNLPVLIWCIIRYWRSCRISSCAWTSGHQVLWRKKRKKEPNCSCHVSVCTRWMLV